MLCPESFRAVCLYRFPRHAPASKRDPPCKFPSPSCIQLHGIQNEVESTSAGDDHVRLPWAGPVCMVAVQQWLLHRVTPGPIATHWDGFSQRLRRGDLHDPGRQLLLSPHRASLLLAESWRPKRSSRDDPCVTPAPPGHIFSSSASDQSSLAALILRGKCWGRVERAPVHLVLFQNRQCSEFLHAGTSKAYYWSRCHPVGGEPRAPMCLDSHVVVPQ